MRGSHTPRSLYLSGMGAVYVCAFMSYWLQYPGLLGASGLLPAGPFWRGVFPNYAGATTKDSFLRLPCLLWFTGELAEVLGRVERLLAQFA